MHDFQRLRVWHEAKDLGVAIYTLCATRPRAEQLVTAQLRRSAMSISTNIAEGCGKSSRAEAIRYLEIASGSAAETEHHLVIARELGIIRPDNHQALLERTVKVRHMLRGLIRRLPR